MSTAVVTRVQSPSLPSRQRSSPGLVDVAMALCWIPFAAAGWLLRGDPTSTAWLVSVTLLISFAHQPLTLALVYGDKRNFDLRRRIFTWSPVVFAIAVLAAQHISLTAVAVVAGVWNAEHTLMQRYGIMRIHGRKAGQDDGTAGQGAAVLVAGAGVRLDRSRWPNAGHIEQTGLRGKNRRGLDILADLQPVARVILPLAATIAVVLTVRWLRDEARRGGRSSRTKRFYTASTAALFVTILVNPVAGFLGYVGAHAIEYFIIVHRSAGPKYANADADGGAPVGYAMRRLGRAGFFAAYIGDRPRPPLGARPVRQPNVVHRRRPDPRRDARLLRRIHLETPSRRPKRDAHRRRRLIFLSNPISSAWAPGALRGERWRRCDVHCGSCA